MGTRNYSPRMTSLTVIRATDRQDTAEERFFQRLEAEVDKVSSFTNHVVNQLRDRLHAVQESVESAHTAEEKSLLLQEAKDIGDEFLQLEKYVNLNYMGFHKALKKHDKMLPHSPCRQFYISHLHNQPWVQGNYSNLLVLLSSVYSQLRGDMTEQKELQPASEDGSMHGAATKPTTARFWVRVGDISAVKHIIVQHLPVYTQITNDEIVSDAELVNSVALDNSSLELYHARLDKRPNAVTMRLRWFGSPDPKIVWLERKTHRESWRGDETIRDSCPLRDDKVVDFLEGDYSPEAYKADLDDPLYWDESRIPLKYEVEKDAAVKVFQECQQLVDVKQLKPMIRTQYMRTTFAIPFDPTVTVNLDTNIAMFKENPEDGPSCTSARRWYRDPHMPLSRTEITRFPHSTLEFKLQLHTAESVPDWVQELLDSGLLLEVHKFSKCIHGVAALFPDAVQAVPYWVDDHTVRASMLLSAPDAPVEIAPIARDQPSSTRRKPRKTLAYGASDDEDEMDGHLDGGDDLTRPLISRAESFKHSMRMSTASWKRKGKAALGPIARALDWWFSKPPPPPRLSIPTPPAPYQPKTFFANERTFLSWLHMAVTMGSISAALLGFAANSKDPAAPRVSRDMVGLIAIILLPIAIIMAGYSLLLFIWRANELRTESGTRFIDDRRGPLVLAGIVSVAMATILLIGLADLLDMIAEGGAPPPPPSFSPAFPPPAMLASL